MSCTTCSLTFTDGPKMGTSVCYEGTWLMNENEMWFFFLEAPVNWTTLSILDTDLIFGDGLVIGWYSLTEGEYTPRAFRVAEAMSGEDVMEAFGKCLKVLDAEDVLVGEDDKKAVEKEILDENVDEEEKALEEEDCSALGSFVNISSSVSATILQICTSANEGRLMIAKEGRCRLKFLNDTVRLISDLVSSQPLATRIFQPFVFLLQNIGRRMSDILEMLRKIDERKATITNNFDIFELKLREQLEEMKTLFPPNAASLVSPTSIISDKVARAAWLNSFGNIHFTTFDNLVKMLIKYKMIHCIGGESSPPTEMYLRYLVNFPADDVISTYKFNHLVCLFGLRDFEENFRYLTEKKGFCGLINRIEAYEILTVSPHSLPVLVRMSRTEPHFLAFSYKDAKGKIFHRVNKDSYGHPIQVEEFIRDKFPHHTLVDMKLNLEKIFGENPLTRSLLEYASESAGYCH